MWVWVCRRETGEGEGEKRRETHQGSAVRNIHMRPVLPPIPLHRSGEEARSRVIASMPSEFLRIAIEGDGVDARALDADAVVGVAVGGVEVEDEHSTSALEDDDLVALVLEADVGLGAAEPAEAPLGGVHGPVEGVEQAVPQQRVVRQVQLPPRVPERVLVALAREVQPLRVPELVALEVEVPLAAQPVRQQPDHLVQRHAPVDDGRQRRQRRHVGVQLGVAEVHHQGLVADETFSSIVS